MCKVRFIRPVYQRHRDIIGLGTAECACPLGIGQLVNYRHTSGHGGSSTVFFDDDADSTRYIQ